MLCVETYTFPPLPTCVVDRITPRSSPEVPTDKIVSHESARPNPSTELIREQAAMGLNGTDGLGFFVMSAESPSSTRASGERRLMMKRGRCGRTNMASAGSETAMGGMGGEDAEGSGDDMEVPIAAPAADAPAGDDGVEDDDDDDEDVDLDDSGNSDGEGGVVRRRRGGASLPPEYGRARWGAFSQGPGAGCTRRVRGGCTRRLPGGRRSGGGGWGTPPPPPPGASSVAPAPRPPPDSAVSRDGSISSSPSSSSSAQSLPTSATDTGSGRGIHSWPQSGE
mmetsp:Transcript_11185/g.22455  ORF Transcript_11185/g.22455 Transcript_11185/m.22455 type:complete len:280 (-) Transcript_11185:981-1820(-)